MAKTKTKRRGLGLTKEQHTAQTGPSIEKVKWNLKQAQAAIEEGNCGKAYGFMGSANYYHGQYIAHRDAGIPGRAAQWASNEWSKVEPMYAKKCVVGYKSALGGLGRARSTKKRR